MTKTKINPPKPSNPNSIEDNVKAFWELISILRERSAWDKIQTHKSIAPLIIEEVYEMIDSINQEDDANFKKELGDILLHVFMHSYFAEERGSFTLIDVISNIHNKLINRLPSVFTDKPIDNEKDLMKDWEKLKKNEGKKSVLSGIPADTPSLLKAQRIQEKASRVGFDWNEKEEVWAKVFEEIEEFKQARELSKDKMEDELGDLLFAIVNAARFDGLSAENAMLRAIKKFKNRFEFIEEKLNENNSSFSDKTLEQLDLIWDEAKRNGL
jgi:XTP/dITP diphosphohydrolase